MRLKESADSGLIYEPGFTSELAEDGWLTSDNEAVENIDSFRERVRVSDDASGTRKRFGRVAVTAEP